MGKAAVEEGIVTRARVAYGGMAGIAARAPATERGLTGQPWTAATIEAAVAGLASDYQPLGDHRASAAYRLTAAGNLLRRFYLEHATAVPGAAPPLVRTAAAGAAAQSR